jgi:uncharacterized protein YciI
MADRSSPSDTNEVPGRWYAYFYLMKPDQEAVRRAAASHASYWHELMLAGYTGGPFADRTGGLILFKARDDHLARDLVDGDPFRREQLLEKLWLKEWSRA